MANMDDYKPRDTSRGYGWLKIRTSLPDDPKYMRLSDLAKVTYFEAYIWAGRSDAGGLILAGDNPAKIDDLAWILRRTIDELQSGLDELESAGLVDLDDGHTIIARFANEQGPSMTDKREQWALRQRNKRENALKIAKPKTDQEPEKEKELDEVKELNQETDQEKIEIKTQTQSVTHTSPESHERVTRDKPDDDLTNEYGSQILAHWQVKTGKTFRANTKFLAMVRRLKEEGVSIKYIDQAIDQSMGTALTPLFLEIAAINLKNADPQVHADKRADEFRKLWQANHTQDGDGVIFAEDTEVSDDGPEA